MNFQYNTGQRSSAYMSSSRDSYTNDNAPVLVPPDGYQWVLAPQRPVNPYGRQNVLVPFSHGDSKNEFQYKTLSSMTRRIRLLRLLPGQREEEPRCELFEAEISPANGKVYRVIDGRKTDISVPYKALSWSWGTDPHDKRILIRQRDGQSQMKAAPALVWALKYLMDPVRDRILWVDAICIDQSSVEEKNHQVQMMAQIYSYADKVCVWLGQETPYSQVAIKFIKEEILQLHRFDELCSNEANAEKWQSLLRLMQRPWFFRRWVVQEIALAKDAEIYCGPDQLAWKDFSVAVELFVEVETATHRLSDVMQKDPRFYHVPGWFEYVSFLGASLLVEATGTVFRTYDRPRGADEDPIALRRPLLSLEYLVSKLSIFRASEPRDAIYALLAIANDGYPAANATEETEALSWTHEVLSGPSDQKPFPVNYGHPYTDVCQDFIQFCIERSNDQSRALDILCRPWAPELRSNTSIYDNNKTRATDTPRRIRKENAIFTDKFNKHYREHSKLWPQMQKYFPIPTKAQDEPPAALPSWIPKDSGAPYEMYEHPGVQDILKLGRKNADPLVAPPGHSRNYDAAQGEDVFLADLRFQKRRHQKVHSMSIRGFVLTEVEEITDASQSGNIPEQWFQLAEWVPNSSSGGRDSISDPPEAFWKTLVADRGKDGHNPPYYYSRACKESVRKGGYVSGSVNTADLINNERNSIVAQFCRRVQAVIWNRQLIKTRLGNLGIARRQVAKQDLVCILYGCSVPVILRRHEKTEVQVGDEEEEDTNFRNLELACQEKYLRRFIRNSKRRRRWKLRPDGHIPREQAKQIPYENPRTNAWKFGKADVKEDMNKWREKLQKDGSLIRGKGSKQCSSPDCSLQPDSVAAQHSKISGKKADEQPIVLNNVWYEFLGECYIHGMMDGEAIRSKADHGKKKNTATSGGMEDVVTQMQRSQTLHTQKSYPESMATSSVGQRSHTMSDALHTHMTPEELNQFYSHMITPAMRRSNGPTMSHGTPDTGLRHKIIEEGGPASFPIITAPEDLANMNDYNGRGQIVGASKDSRQSSSGSQITSSSDQNFSGPVGDAREETGNDPKQKEWEGRTQNGIPRLRDIIFELR